MAKHGKTKNKKGIRKIIMIIIAIVAVLFILFKLSDLIVFGKNKKTNLVINNKNVTAFLKKDILIEDNNIYISKQDLANFFDKYIYEDEENNQIVTTYETKIGAISLKENQININGSNRYTTSHAMKKEDTIYVPIKELKDVYGIDIKYIEKTKVLVLDSVAKEQKNAMAKKSLAVKSSKGIIAKTVDKIKKKDYVVVASEGNGYSLIRTGNGKVGYVKSNKLTNVTVVREEMKEEKQIDGKVNLVWDYYSEYAKTPSRNGEKMEGVNVVSPAFFHLNSKGELIENIGSEGQAYITWAHNNGYKVWPMVQNAGEGMINVTSDILNSYDKRQSLIEDIVKACVKYKLDGVNIDFENMKESDKDMFSRLIIEMTPRINDIGMIVSVDVTAPDGGETWSMCFDRNVIGNVADYIVFMAYDEYGASSNKAGTTAGYNWVELSLKKFLETEEIKSDKIILAVPLFARLWTEDSNGKILKQSTVSLKNMDEIIPNGVQKEWKKDEKQYYIEYQEGSTLKKIWLEDEKSLSEKISLIREKNLAGVASWTKDMEYKEYWGFLQNELTK